MKWSVTAEEIEKRADRKLANAIKAAYGLSEKEYDDQKKSKDSD